MANLESWRVRRRIELILRHANRCNGRGSVSAIVWRRGPGLEYESSGVVVRQHNPGMDSIQFYVLSNCVQVLEKEWPVDFRPAKDKRKAARA